MFDIKDQQLKHIHPNVFMKYLQLTNPNMETNKNKYINTQQLIYQVVKMKSNSLKIQLELIKEEMEELVKNNNELHEKMKNFVTPIQSRTSYEMVDMDDMSVTYVSRIRSQ